MYCSEKGYKKMIRIGIVGLGFMGVTHYKAIQKVRGGKVVAVCTRDRRKLAGDWRGVQGNFGGSGGVQNLESVARYRQVDALFADANVDLGGHLLTNAHALRSLHRSAYSWQTCVGRKTYLALAAASRWHARHGTKKRNGY